MPQVKFSDPGVAEIFAAFPRELRPRLLELRALILDVAARSPTVGTILEALRWGQPSYLTPESGSGSIIRIDRIKSQPGKVAVYFHCQSGLIGEFRELYGNRLKFEGKRCIVLDVQETLPNDAMSHCIRLALTYHHRKKTRPRVRPK